MQRPLRAALLFAAFRKLRIVANPGKIECLPRQFGFCHAELDYAHFLIAIEIRRADELPQTAAVSIAETRIDRQAFSLDGSLQHLVDLKLAAHLSLLTEQFRIRHLDAYCNRLHAALYDQIGTSETLLRGHFFALAGEC